MMVNQMLDMMTNTIIMPVLISVKKHPIYKEALKLNSLNTVSLSYAIFVIVFNALSTPCSIWDKALRTAMWLLLLYVSSQTLLPFIPNFRISYELFKQNICNSLSSYHFPFIHSQPIVLL